MPTYVYECSKCGDEFELYQSFSDAPLRKHPGCGGRVTKVFQPVGIVLKGSGFYKNDSRSGAKRSNGNAAKSESSSESSESSSANGSTSEKAEQKTDKKSEKKSDAGAKKASKPSTPAAKSS